MEKYSTRDVFTPTTSAKLTFVEREEINEQLVDAIIQPGKQIVVYGHSGSGKTTLVVNKLNQLYEGFIVSRCTETTTLDELILDAFDQLNGFYTSDFVKKKGLKVGLDIGTSYSEIKGLLKSEYSSETSTTSKRILPPQLTEQRLARFLGAAKYCWVLEDFHKVKTHDRKLLSQKMKVFKDTADEYPEVKIIAIGAVGSAREIIENEKEMNTRVEEIHVPLMNREQLLEILRKGEDFLNISFPDEIKNRILNLSNGLGAVCHQLCLNMCAQSNILQRLESLHTFNGNDLNRAVEKYIRSQSETLLASFDNAIKIERSGGKFENGKLILRALSGMIPESSTHSEILAEIHNIEPNYPAGNLTTYLKKLTSSDRDEILRCDEKSGKYSFSNPFLKVYSKMKLEEINSLNTSSINVGNSQLIIGDNHGSIIFVGDINLS